MTAATIAAAITTGVGATTPPDRPPIRALAHRAIMESTWRGRTAHEWAIQYRHRTRQLQHVRTHLHQARRVLMQHPTVVEAINLACAVYGSCNTLWSLARCESQLNPNAKNRSSDASGLMQFMPGTFTHTPFGRFSIWSPYANAMAAGWMLQQGRRSEWVC